MNKYASSLKYGVIAGIAMIAIISLIYKIDINGMATMWPRLAYVLLIFTMVWGGITARRKLGNFDGFGHAFLTVFIISFTATMLFDSYNYVLNTVIDPKIAGVVKAKLIEDSLELSDKLGLSNDKRDAAVAELKAADYSYTSAKLVQRYISSIIIGAILSLVIGLFVNRPDERPITKAGE